ncbi:MAG: manganese efflux pump [Deltaproteobacteria bacterium]|nr:manganese efflux pump [Deltaproteobacteria bacterium]
MDILTLVGIAFALSMDAFAVSVASGIRLKSITYRHVFRLAWHFGLFQALMPVIGWSAGLNVRSYIEQYDHWVAFGLLVFVGGNMVREAFHQDRDESEKNDPTKGKTLVMLSVATSIDAFAVGLSFSMLNISILFPAVIIGFVAAVSSVVGIQIGRKVGNSTYLCSYAEGLGGIVLMVIGLTILREHGAFDFFL